MHAVPDLLFGEQREEALHLVQPRAAGRGQVNVPARSFGQPVPDDRRLVSAVVIDDKMDIQIIRNIRFDVRKKPRNS